MFNPTAAFAAVPANGQYDGSTFANIGILGPDPGQAQSFDLTFTEAGTYSYVCLVHSVEMSGKIIVLDHPGQIRAPGAVEEEAGRLIAVALAQTPAGEQAGSVPLGAEFVHSFLEELDYQAKRTDKAWAFHHNGEGLLVFRLYDEHEPVDERDLLNRREFLDWRGLLDATAFDAFLQRATISA